jgi:hypothetical protein
MEEAERWLKHQCRVIVQAGALRRGTPARELDPIVIHRLGLDTGG